MRRQQAEAHEEDDSMNISRERLRKNKDNVQHTDMYSNMANTAPSKDYDEPIKVQLWDRPRPEPRWTHEQPSERDPGRESRPQYRVVCTENIQTHYYPDPEQRERLYRQIVVEPDVQKTSRRPAPRQKNERETSSGKYTADDIPRLREQWHEKYKDLMNGVPPTMPPLRAVNHEIPIIDDTIKYQYHKPRCPHSLQEAFRTKANRYIEAGWWEPADEKIAAPMMCIPKKDNGLRTVVDLRQRNDNTAKDVTPMPDQEMIREDVARKKYRSKIDLSDAYEQVRIVDKDVPKTAFNTVIGTFFSRVMQQGDCNAPSTFQRLMTHLFRDIIGIFIHVYLDDLFIYSDTIEEHEQHIGIVMERLKEAQLYLKWSKCDLYSEQLDCLGHIIDDDGIHADNDKLERIREWRTPRNYNDVQKFVGLVMYLAPFLPDIAAYTGTLLSLQQNGHAFAWRPVHQRCFEMIKNICCKAPILKPIDPRSQDKIWVVCDASKTGVGAMLGQGVSWETCRPAGFLSRKFTAAQQNYRVFEQETLAILEALMKWEDKLIGYQFHVITDHQALEFFHSQDRLSPRQMRWADYMSRFNLDITYIKGELNKVADALSRYYESDRTDEHHHTTEYVRADVRIDPGAEDLPNDRALEVTQNIVELRAMEVEGARRSKRLQERQEIRDLEAQELKEAAEKSSEGNTSAPEPMEEMTLQELLDIGPDLRPREIEPDGFLKAVQNSYDEDRLFKLIRSQPNSNTGFKVDDEGLVWHTNRHGEDTLGVPDGELDGRKLREIVIDQAHRALGHFGTQRTTEYIRRWYWWPSLYTLTDKFCRSCEPCQRAKSTNQQPAGLLHTLPVPNQPWDSIGMDFVGPFPEIRERNYLWVVLCRLTSMVHLIPVHTTMTASELSWIYRRDIVRLHGLPTSIVSDRDSKFTSKWWRGLHRILGANLLMSTSFHPQTDGQTERMNRNVAQIVRGQVQPDQHDWLDSIDMTEFAINSSISDTTGFAPFELNYGYMPSFIRHFPAGEKPMRGIKAFAETALRQLAKAHDAIIERRVFQTANANKRRREEPEIYAGSLVYLSTKNLNLPKGRAKKLVPKYIGPYKVLQADHVHSTYKLQLPVALQRRRIHDRFHVSLLKPYHANNDALFPQRIVPGPYDFGAPDSEPFFVEEISGHRWDKDRGLQLEVQWSNGKTTWEEVEECKALTALTEYLATQGVRRPAQLVREEGRTTTS